MIGSADQICYRYARRRYSTGFSEYPEYYLGVEATALMSTVPYFLDRHTALLGHQILRRGHVMLSAGRMCPLCVSELGYGKLQWTLAPLSVCDEHGVYLIDRCPCSRALARTRRAYAYCSCGLDLRQAPTSQASHEARALARAVSQRFHFGSHSEIADAFPVLADWPCQATFGDFLDLIIFLGGLADRSRTFRCSLARPLSRMDSVIEQFERAAHVLSLWQGGLASALDIAISKQSAGEPPYEHALKVVQSRMQHRLSPTLQAWLSCVSPRARAVSQPIQ